MAKRKRVNPHRIPLAKSAIDKDAILEEAMHGDMYRAWLLVINAMVELELVQVTELPSMADAVNIYISNSSRSPASQQNEINRAEKLMGIQNPYENLDPNTIKSPVELVKFKKKVFRVATHTALCVICLGLEAAGRFSKEDLRRLFFNVDLTLTEIEAGCSSYESIEKCLAEKSVKVEVDDGDYSIASIKI